MPQIPDQAPPDLINRIREVQEQQRRMRAEAERDAFDAMMAREAERLRREGMNPPPPPDGMLPIRKQRLRVDPYAEAYKLPTKTPEPPVRTSAAKLKELQRENANLREELSYLQFTGSTPKAFVAMLHKVFRRHGIKVRIKDVDTYRDIATGLSEILWNIIGTQDVEE